MTLHLEIIDYGYLRRRLQFCGRRSCQVYDDWTTDCVNLACPECGAGPPMILPDGDGHIILTCDVCGCVGQR